MSQTGVLRQVACVPLRVGDRNFGGAQCVLEHLFDAIVYSYFRHDDTGKGQDKVFNTLSSEVSLGL